MLKKTFLAGLAVFGLAFTDAQAAALEERGIPCIPSPDLESALARTGGDRPVVILGTTSLISDAERLFR